MTRAYSLFLIFCLQLGAALPTHAIVKVQRLWSRSTLEKPYLLFRAPHKMAPLLTDELVIQGNAIDGIVAYDRASGNQRWRRMFKNGVEGGAALSGDKVYFGANNGQFYCLNAKTGDVIWSYPVNSESLTPPLIRGSYVYHVTSNNTLYAFDADSGRSLWIKTRGLKAVMTVRGQTAPVFHNGVIYVGFSDGFFSALNAENGRQLWSKRIGDDKKFNDVDASARITDQCVLVASYANALYCLDRSSGNIKWRHDTGGFQPVLADGARIFYPTGTGEIHVLDGPSGKLLKQIPLRGGFATEIIAFNNFLIYGETQGSLVVLDKSNLTEYARFSPGRGIFARPTIDPSNNEIFVLSNEANLYKIKLQAKVPSPFPWSR